MMELLLDKLSKTRSNMEFLAAMSGWGGEGLPPQPDALRRGQGALAPAACRMGYTVVCPAR